MDCGQEGLEPSVGPFQSSGGAARSVSCRVPMPAGLFTDHGWDGSPATGPFRLYRLFGRLTSRGSQIMAGSGCGPFQAAQPGPGSVCLLLNAWVGRTAPRSLVYGAGDRTSRKGW